MKLQVTQENLTRALSTVARVANVRGTLPILANVLIKAEGNRLSISATNLDIAITEFCGAKILSEGSITVPARLMQDYIASLPSGVIDIELKDQKLEIKAKDYNSTIIGTEADDFPVMPAIEDGKTISLPAQSFKRALQQTAFAAASDESRPILTAVYLHSFEGNLHLAATDSHRLASKRLDAAEGDISLLLPVSAMQDVLRIIGDAVETVTVSYNEQQALFEIGDVELVARLIDGKYPDYRKLLPKSFEHTATVGRSELTQITKVASLFARESAGSVKLATYENDGELEVRSVASQIGENSSRVSGKVKGSSEITLNSKYLIDALGAFSADEITVGFNGKLEPVVLSSSKDDSYVHLVMPLKS